MWVLNMPGKKLIPYCQNRHFISHIAKRDPYGLFENILIKLNDVIYLAYLL